MLDGAVAPSGRAYTSARTPARLPSNRPPPTPEEVHQRVHDRVFKYLYKQPGFLHPFEHHTKEIYRKLRHTAEPIDLTVYPETLEPKDDDPLVAFRYEAERSMTAEGETVWTLAWDRLELPLQGRDLVVKAIEVTLKRVPRAYHRLLRDPLPDPFPTHLQPLEPILTRKELITTACLSATRKLPAPSMRCQLFERKGKYSIGGIMMIEPVGDGRANGAEALDVELRSDEPTKRSAKEWREGWLARLQSLIKGRKRPGHEAPWDEWRNEDIISQAAAPRPWSPPLVPRRGMIHEPMEPFNFNHLRLYPLHDACDAALPTLKKLVKETEGLTLASVVQKLKAHNITDEEQWRLSDPLRLELLDDFDETPLEPLTPTTAGPRTPSSGPLAKPLVIDLKTCLKPSRKVRLVEDENRDVYYPKPFSHRRHRATVQQQDVLEHEHSLPYDSESPSKNGAQNRAVQMRTPQAPRVSYYARVVNEIHADPGSPEVFYIEAGRDHFRAASQGVIQLRPPVRDGSFDSPGIVPYGRHLSAGSDYAQEQPFDAGANYLGGVGVEHETGHQGDWSGAEQGPEGHYEEEAVHTHPNDQQYAFYGGADHIDGGLEPDYTSAIPVDHSDLEGDTAIPENLGDIHVPGHIIWNPQLRADVYGSSSHANREGEYSATEEEQVDLDLGGDWPGFVNGEMPDEGQADYTNEVMEGCELDGTTAGVQAWEEQAVYDAPSDWSAEDSAHSSGAAEHHSMEYAARSGQAEDYVHEIGGLHLYDGERGADIDFEETWEQYQQRITDPGEHLAGLDAGYAAQQDSVWFGQAHGQCADQPGGPETYGVGAGMGHAEYDRAAYGDLAVDEYAQGPAPEQRPPVAGAWDSEDGREQGASNAADLGHGYEQEPVAHTAHEHHRGPEGHLSSAWQVKREAASQRGQPNAPDVRQGNELEYKQGYEQEYEQECEPEYWQNEADGPQQVQSHIHQYAHGDGEQDGQEDTNGNVWDVEQAHWRAETRWEDQALEQETFTEAGIAARTWLEGQFDLESGQTKDSSHFGDLLREAENNTFVGYGVARDTLAEDESDPSPDTYCPDPPQEYRSASATFPPPARRCAPPALSFDPTQAHNGKAASSFSQAEPPLPRPVQIENSKPVKKRKGLQPPPPPTQSFEALCAASNPTSAELERVVRPVKKAKLKADPNLKSFKTLDDVLRAQRPIAFETRRANANDVGKQAQDFFATVDLQVASSPSPPPESTRRETVKPPSKLPADKTKKRKSQEWKNHATIRNPPWWDVLAQNAQTDLEEVPVLVNISVTRQRSLAKALEKAFVLVERSIELRTGSVETAELGSPLLRYGCLQGADMVLSASTAVVFYRIGDITLSLNDIVARLAGTARYYERILVVFEVVDYNTRRNPEDTDGDVNPLSTATIQAVPSLRRGIAGLIAEAEVSVDLIFACEGPERLARTIRTWLEEEFVELRKAYGDALMRDACEGRGEWILRDESEQSVMVQLSFDLNAFACGYIVHKTSSIDTFVFECTAQDRTKLVQHVLGTKQTHRVNELIADRLNSINLSSDAGSSDKEKRRHAEKTRTEELRSLVADVSVEELDDYELSD